MAEQLYNLLLYTVGWGMLPLMLSKAGDDAAFRKGRLGFYSGQIHQSHGRQRPRVWFHASSVGEVTGAVPIIQLLHQRMGHAEIFLTVATPQGYRFAREKLPAWVQVLAFPLDYPHILGRAFDHIRPDIFVALESEFWPNLYYLLQRRQVPTVLLNGRLSAHSARTYRKLGPLFKPIFRQFRWLAMHSEEDRRNVLQLGASDARTLVLGSSKYEGLLARARPEAPAQWHKLLRIDPSTPVLVGGSLRRAECVELPHIYQRLAAIEPNLVAILAPRHLEQAPLMAQRMTAEGIEFQLLTQLENGAQSRQAPVILVDRIGALFELYSLGSLIFVGGTLVDIGGHNILEPAVWQKPVFYGPHLQKVDYEHKILQVFGGSFLVNNFSELLNSWSRWITNLPGLKAHGEKAVLALEQLRGVVTKQVDLITTTLRSKNHLAHAR